MMHLSCLHVCHSMWQELAERRVRHKSLQQTPYLLSEPPRVSRALAAQSRVYLDRDRYVRPAGSSQFLSELSLRRSG